MATVLKFDIQRDIRLLPGYDPFALADGCWFDEEAAVKACDFFPECLRHIEGAMAGQPFVLEPWQRGVIGNLFGWKRRDAHGREVRRYREALIYVPRKNGKTPLVAGVGLYVFFCEPERGQQDYIAAAEREQAGLLFRHCKGMVEQEPELSSRCRIFGGNAAAGQSRSIVREFDGSFLRVVSADATTKHGGNPHLTIIDELHAQPDAELYDVLHTGMASQNRAEPLFICLTTADYDRESVCNERYEYACGVRDGKIPDPSFLPVIFEALPEDDWTDPKTWAKANPNLGVSVSEEYLRTECEKAQRIPRLQNGFKRLHLDLRTKQDVLWLQTDKWDACGGEMLELPDDVPVYGGVDLASRIDLTALAWLWRRDGKVHIKVRCWAPEERIRYLESEQHDQRYRLWQRAGWLEATPGDTIDYGFIHAAIEDDSHRCEVREIGYDPWNAKQFAQGLQDAGFQPVEFRQGYASLSEPSKELERLIVAGEIVHEQNPVLDWMIGNVQVRPDPAGNIKPVKPEPGSPQKIDGVIAVIMALGVEIRQPDGTSAYEERGVLYADELDEDEETEAVIEDH